MPSTLEHYLAKLVDPKQTVRTSGLINLSGLDRLEIVLFKQAWNNIDAEKRCHIIQQLVGLAEDNAELDFEAVFRICLEDAEEKVRVGAIKGLWESEDASLIAPLIRLLKDDVSVAVREAAAIALGKFALLAELLKIHPRYASQISAVLLATLKDGSESLSVRRRALEAVASLTLPEVTASIAEAYQSNEQALKMGAIYAMGQNCDPRWLPVLEKELTGSEPEARFEAANACGELGMEETVPSLVQLINDSDHEVQFAAIRALGKIGGNEAKKALQLRLNHPEASIRQAVKEGLLEIESEIDLLSTKTMLQ